MVWGVIFFRILIQDIGDIKVGDCLTFDEAQAVVGVERKDIYQGGDCDTDYATDGALTQTLTCGLELNTGEWHRSMVKHKKPGFYFFGAPCYESPQTSSYENTTYSEVSSDLVCTKENSTVVKYQQEKMETAHYDIASGEAYLPNPLWVHQETFGNDDQGKYVKLSCTESEARAAYTGWGAFSARWTKKSCDSDQLTECKEAALSASQNDKGQTCLQVNTLTDCLPTPTPTPEP